MAKAPPRTYIVADETFSTYGSLEEGDACTGEGCPDRDGEGGCSGTTGSSTFSDGAGFIVEVGVSTEVAEEGVWLLPIGEGAEGVGVAIDVEGK